MPNNWDWLKEQAEGQFLERKSCYDRSKGQFKPRLLLREKGFVKNEDIREALGVSLIQANWIARKLVALGWLEPQGEKRGRRYVIGRRVIESSQKII